MTHDRHQTASGATACRPSQRARRPASPSNQRGFTLVELLVSLVIAAFILAILAASGRLISQGWRLGSQSAGHQDMLARGLGALRRDLEAMRPVSVGKEKDATVAFSGGPSTLSMIVNEPPFPGNPGPHVVRYEVQRRDDGVRLIRTRRPLPSRLSWPVQAVDQDPVVILEQLSDIRFAFFDASGDGAWRETWSASQAMPRLVQVSLKSTQRHRIPDLIVRPRIDASLGCVVQTAGRCVGRRGKDEGQRR